MTDAPVEIRAGLRKLEFRQSTDREPSTTAVVVEFVLSVPLAERAKVRVPLGMRSGVLRELVGEPQLLGTTRPAAGNREYRYRLSGEVNEALG